MERHPFWIRSGKLSISPHHSTLLSGSPVQATLITSRLLQRANLKGSRTGSDGVISDGGIAAGQDNVGLARYGCGAVRCGWDGEGETSIDGGCAVG